MNEYEMVPRRSSGEERELGSVREQFTSSDPEPSSERPTAGLNQTSIQQSPQADPIQEQQQSHATNQSYARSASPAFDTVSASKPGVTGKRTKSKVSLHRLWIWELGCLVLSVACMLAVIIILSSMDGKPLASWKAPITLNTAVSTLATLAESAMLVGVEEGISQLKWIYFEQRAHRISDLQTFDEASRGPWGALMFLYRIRWHASVAAVGSAIVLFALAMQSFTQQTIKTPIRSVVAHNFSSAIPRTQNFDTNRPLKPSDTSLESIKFEFPLGKQYDVGVNDAVYTGLFAPQLQVEFQCPSGNCTWEFETLGICGECTDVSAQLQKQCQIGQANPEYYGTLQLPRSQTCNYTTPGGFNTTVWACLNSNNDSSILNSSSRVGDLPWDLLISTAFFHLPATLESVPNTDAINSSAHCQWYQPKAYECELTWCAKKYSSKFERGSLVDQPISAEPLFFGPATMYTTEQGYKTCQGTQAGIETCLSDAGESQGVAWRTPGFKAQDVPTNWTASNQSTLENQSKAFWINTADAYDIQNSLQNIFNANLDSHMSSTSNQFISEKLYNLAGKNMAQAMEGMATSLTNAIRQGANETSVSGTSYHDQTFVAVDWPWLILPLGLVLVSGVFLAACIAFSFGQKDLVWKSSILPALFVGLSGWSKDELSMKSLPEMEESAKDMFALLELRGPNGISLSRC